MVDTPLIDLPSDEDNITDWCLDQFRSHYGAGDITKDDIWEYLYGVMHAPDWRERYKHDLQRNLPRVPFAPDFEAFRKAGRRLMDLHAGYEYVPEWDVECHVDGEPDEGEADPDCYRIVENKKMRWGKTDGEEDRSVFMINDRCKLVGIPKEAHGYTVSGRTPLEWAIDSLRWKHDKKSGIVDDPNGWHVWADEPFNLIRHLRRLVHVSVETTRIVEDLPCSLVDNGLSGHEGPGVQRAAPSPDGLGHKTRRTGPVEARQPSRPSVSASTARQPRPAPATRSRPTTPTAPAQSERPEDWPVPYTEWKPDGSVPDPRTAERGRLVDLLTEVARCEGPVVAIRAYRLINRASGSRRFTKQARKPLNQACHAAVREGRLIATNLFDKPGQAHRVLQVPDRTGRIVPRRRGPRQPMQELPPEEIVEMMKRLNEQAPPPDSEALKRLVVAQLDLFRLTPTVNEFLDRCIDVLD